MALPDADITPQPANADYHRAVRSIGGDRICHPRPL